MKANEVFLKFLNELMYLIRDADLMPDFYQENDMNYAWLNIANCEI